MKTFAITVDLLKAWENWKVDVPDDVTEEDIFNDPSIIFDNDGVLKDSGADEYVITEVVEI